MCISILYTCSRTPSAHHKPYEWQPNVIAVAPNEASDIIISSFFIDPCFLLMLITIIIYIGTDNSFILPSHKKGNRIAFVAWRSLSHAILSFWRLVGTCMCYRPNNWNCVACYHLHVTDWLDSSKALRHGISFAWNDVGNLGEIDFS